MAKYILNPWLEIQGMKEKMDSLMEEALERYDIREKTPERLVTWCPVADVYETDTAYVLQVELAGLKREEVTLEVNNNELWVHGERKMMKEVSSNRYHFLERSYGPFARKFVFQEKVDSENIRASFQDGVLTITMKKRGPTEKSHTIKIDEEES